MFVEFEGRLINLNNVFSCKVDNYYFLIKSAYNDIQINCGTYKAAEAKYEEFKQHISGLLLSKEQS